MWLPVFSTTGRSRVVMIHMCGNILVTKTRVGWVVAISQRRDRWWRVVPELFLFVRMDVLIFQGFSPMNFHTCMHLCDRPLDQNRKSFWPPPYRVFCSQNHHDFTIRQFRNMVNHWRLKILAYAELAKRAPLFQTQKVKGTTFRPSPGFITNG